MYSAVLLVTFATVVRIGQGDELDVADQNDHDYPLYGRELASHPVDYPLYGPVDYPLFGPVDYPLFGRLYPWYYPQIPGDYMHGPIGPQQGRSDLISSLSPAPRPGSLTACLRSCNAGNCARRRDGPWFCRTKFSSLERGAAGVAALADCKDSCPDGGRCLLQNDGGYYCYVPLTGHRPSVTDPAEACRATCPPLRSVCVPVPDHLVQVEGQEEYECVRLPGRGWLDRQPPVQGQRPVSPVLPEPSGLRACLRSCSRRRGTCVKSRVGYRCRPRGIRPPQTALPPRPHLP